MGRPPSKTVLPAPTFAAALNFRSRTFIETFKEPSFATPRVRTSSQREAWELQGDNLSVKHRFGVPIEQLK